MNKGFTRIGLIIAFALLLLILFLFTGGAGAIAPAPYKTICHHTPGNQVTLNFQNVQSYNGHLGTPHSESTYDTDGECEEETSTPTPTDEPTPTPDPCDEQSLRLKVSEDIVIDPCVTPTPTEEPTPTPTSTPSATPTPEVVIKVHQPSQPATAPQCADTVPGSVGGIYVDRGIANDGKLEVRWWEPSGADKVHIRYTDGEVGDWKYAVLHVPNTGSYEIGDLVNGNHYWFQVAGVNGCAVGNWSDAFDPLP